MKINRVIRHSLLLIIVCSSVISIADQQDKKVLDDTILVSLQKDDYGTFKRSLENGANPNHIGGAEEHQWLLCLASQYNNTEYLENLLSNGGNPNLKNENATAWVSTPLNCAAIVGNVNALKLLVLYGANPNVNNCDHCIGALTTPYSTAIVRKNYKALYELLLLVKIEEKYVNAINNGIASLIPNRDSEEFQWRAKVADLLQQQGHAVDARYRGECLTDIGCLEE